MNLKGMSNQQLSIWAVIVSIILIASSSNPPDGRTGAPGDGLCSNCHSQGSSGNLAGNIAISGLPGTITPGTTYNITVTINNMTSPPTDAERGGFELLALDGSNVNTGTFSNAGSGSTFSGSSKVYWKHATAKNFNGGSSVTYTASWKAPNAAGGNTITMYVAGIIANIPNGNSNDLEVTNEATATLQTNAINIALVQKKNISCFGGNDGMIQVSASGGQSPYAYSWSNGATTSTINNLIAGTYTVTVTDANNNTNELTTSITEPTAITITTLEKNDISCYGKNDGKISISSAGGTGVKTYKWNSNQTTSMIANLKKGMYTCTVTDANNCKVTENYTIAEPDSLRIVSQIINPSCPNKKDGKITITTSGGTPNYTFNWSNASINSSLADIGIGNYKLTITDANDCSKTYNFDIKSRDTIKPKLELQTADLILDSTGKVSINPMRLIKSSSDNCDTNLIIKSTPLEFFCSDLGKQKVYVEVKDGSNNATGDSIEVNVIDNIAPKIICNNQVNTYDCNYIIPAPIEVRDNCSIKNYRILNPNLKIGDALHYGNHVLIYQVSDNAGNTGTCRSAINIVPSSSLHVDTIIQGQCPIDGIQSKLRIDVNTSNNKLYINNDSILFNHDTIINYKSNIYLYYLSLQDSLHCVTQMDTLNFVPKWEIITLDAKQLINPTSSTASDGMIQLSISGGATPLNYILRNSAGTLLTTSMDPSFKNLSEGSYYIQVQDKNGCITELGPFELKFTSSTNEHNKLITFGLAPNPAYDQLYINTNVTIDDIIIYDTKGNKMDCPITLNPNILAIAQLQSGLYIGTIKFSNNQYRYFRFIKM